MNQEKHDAKQKPLYRSLAQAIEARTRVLFDIASNATTAYEVQDVVEELISLDGMDDTVLQTTVNCIRLRNDAPLAVLRALEDLIDRHSFDHDPDFISILAQLTLSSNSPAVRLSAIGVLGAIRPRHDDDRMDAAELFGFIIHNDDDAPCRLAAVTAIVSTGCERWATPALLFALSDIRPARLAALLALESARPTRSLIETLTRLIIAHHDDDEIIDYAIDILARLLRRGYSLAPQWSVTVARLLATATEFCLPEHTLTLMKAHAAAIVKVGMFPDCIVCDLLRAFDQRRSAYGAPAYLDAITTMGFAAVNPLIALAGEADAPDVRLTLLELLRRTIFNCWTTPSD